MGGGSASHNCIASAPSRTPADSHAYAPGSREASHQPGMVATSAKKGLPTNAVSNTVVSDRLPLAPLA
ncbi:hypothetical protein Hypma_002054 [Hypsizygus marmoreus]|uniref:Uncharacterized protein n=1 Tax=Hypsizygus marmoreus TaxID=39966 RepID=A0A369J9A6_HYPMA|nr:hypothetical protein Hypma_002054 [Hypsizygus marmoreus]